ncbi:MAG: helix-turn-helix transcriptional regulator [Lachnospiraceae bacterium]|nr:helix-turn-helix transcriptional regulator [Lachnospiraceae bacterium]
MAENMEDIGNIIRNSRVERHLTQEKLAELIEVSAGFVGQIERDEAYPSLRILFKLIRVLKIDSNVLFYPFLQKQGSKAVEFGLRFGRLSKGHQELVITLMDKLEELQEEENSSENQYI